jgi:two-component system, NtrC family, sensor kinase
VACNWRIRHKLMLGMGLIGAVMALLLGGTLYGLASYRAAMGTCTSKLKEQELVAVVKDKVRLLTKSPPGPAMLREHIRAGTPEIRRTLDAYNDELHYTIDHKRALHGGKEALAFVEELKKNLGQLETALDKEDAPGTNRPGLLDPKSDVRQAIDQLDRNLGDLEGSIGGDIGKMVNLSRTEAQKSIWLLACTGVLAVLLMAGLLRFFYRWVAQPIRDLELGVSRVAKGDFQHRIDISSGDEIQDLAKSYNEMTDKLRAMYENLAQQVNERSRQLVRSEQLAGVGFLAAGVAHEINNPLAGIALAAESLESRLSDLLQSVPMPTQDRETIARYLKMIQEEAFRCKEITEKLLTFSRGGERSRGEADLGEVIQGVLDVVKHLQNSKGKRIEFQPAGPMLAWVNAQEIKQVFLNLVVNALESMDEGGTLSIAHSIHDGQIELIFKDTGCGMTPDVLQNIFEPFFTRSRTGKGTGLGLSISHRIVTQHGGEIAASSDGPGKGSTFKIRLPIQPPANPVEPGQEVQDPVEEFLKLSSAKRNAKAA